MQKYWRVVALPFVPVLAFALITGVVWRARVVQIHPRAGEGSVVASSAEAFTPLLSPTGVDTTVQSADARPEIVAQFLRRHDSPLTPYDYFGKVLVDTADRYQLDYRLLPAIMMQESNLCKAHPEGTYNCLGFGIHERGTLGFESYEAGFDRAARELKKRYVDIGLTTPEQIMKKYTPSSNGSWAFSVNQWITEMEYNDRERARTDRQDNNLLEYTGS